MTRLALLFAAGLLCAGPALAQHAGHGAPANTPATPPQAQQDRAVGGDGDRQGRTAGGTPAPADPATARFQAVNQRMHQAMGAPLTGDVNVDFARGMIPHHQGAVEMAKIMLEHGRDPELR